MSAMVNMWIGELSKLTDKIHLKKNHQQLPNFFIKSQTETDDQVEEHEALGITLMESEKAAPVVLKSPATEERSEETVFWLMDRFAPC
ncbi:hypothetical protein Hanom_Chr03g00227871 [Helianthus anomalus]